MKLTKSDVRRALVRHHFATSPTQYEAFERLRSVQFDPIAPVGCNHDLVLQARVPGYKIGDWEKLAYQERTIYDGWDKQASLVPFEGWPLRRIIYALYRKRFEEGLFAEYPEAVQSILANIRDRGPLMPKECDFQLSRAELKSHWHSPNVTKRVLRGLWHTGQIMTAGRKGIQHVYDLTERVVPAHLQQVPQLPDDEARKELVLERHRAMGLVRPAAPAEVWSLTLLGYTKNQSNTALVGEGRIVPVEVEGVKAHATPEFLSRFDEPALEPRVVFIGPLDPFLWDRKMTAHLFGFDYVWEIYVPEPKRRWGYYVLPILYGDRLVARAEFWCRNGVLEVREWHTEPDPDPAFWPALQEGLQRFLGYCNAGEVVAREKVDPKVKEVLARTKK